MMDTEHEMSMDPQYEGWSESYKQRREDMEPQQEQHLASIKGEFTRLVDEKYRKGQRSHGGDMPLKPGMLKMLEEEMVDGMVYYLTVRAQLRHAYRRIAELVQQGRRGSMEINIREILNEVEQVGFHLEQIVEGDN
jgi:hypothetical protein